MQQILWLHTKENELMTSSSEVTSVKISRSMVSKNWKKKNFEVLTGLFVL